jgi:transcriptional regulator with XRE-family HTH domain
MRGVTAGKFIREARKAVGLSQRDLAERAGVPRQSIVRWERGAVEPGFDTVRRLVRCCGYDLSLIRYEPDESVDARLSSKRELTPQERALAMLEESDATP